MLLIGITEENFFENEAGLIACALENGIDRIHIRKPGAETGRVKALIESIPSGLHSRLVLHDFFSLCQSFTLGGVHLNSRNPEAPEGFACNISRSCHSIGELNEARKYGYVFLSPIFDSLSKQGYRAAFTENILQEAAENGLIHPGVIALGGITPERMDTIRSYGFGGAAILGYLWKEKSREGMIKRIGYFLQNIQTK